MKTPLELPALVQNLAYGIQVFGVESISKIVSEKRDAPEQLLSCVVSIGLLRLIFQYARGATGHPRVERHQRTLYPRDGIRRDQDGLYSNRIVFCETNEVQPSKRGGVLILLAYGFPTHFDLNMTALFSQV